MDEKPLISIKGLTVSFTTDDGALKAVDDVSFDIHRGEALGIVGESGCGKSVTAMSMLRLVPCPPGSIDQGTIMMEGDDLLRMDLAMLRKVRGRRVGVIFQEPMTALSPLHQIGQQMIEAQRLHRDITRDDARRESVRWLEKVGIPDPTAQLQAYPFQLSGGMRQRVMIATALMLDPDLIIADEPTTALDVTIQAQVLDLMHEMRKDDTALVLITHDMGVIWEMCTRVVVMYASEVVEIANRDALFEHPLHPYTEALLASIPSLEDPAERLPTIPGQVPSPLDYPAGCRFRERCPYAFERCGTERPALTSCDGRLVRCFRAEENAR